ncbi:MAG: hypothetical protein B6245_20615 [Desulfobacteraceae bacterium 4572_88]|nr:MAG: hypothetical protein B6245_20615 [Desulfobacteraceae bacterium 4572_88]
MEKFRKPGAEPDQIPLRQGVLSETAECASPETLPCALKGDFGLKYSSLPLRRAISHFLPDCIGTIL